MGKLSCMQMSVKRHINWQFPPQMCMYAQQTIVIILFVQEEWQTGLSHQVASGITRNYVWKWISRASFACVAHNISFI